MSGGTLACILLHFMHSALLDAVRQYGRGREGGGGEAYEVLLAGCGRRGWKKASFVLKSFVTIYFVYIAFLAPYISHATSTASEVERVFPVY